MTWLETTATSTSLTVDTPGVACPFSGSFKFSYSRGQGECREPLSSIESCTEESRLVFRFQACADVPGSESRGELVLGVTNISLSHFLSSFMLFSSTLYYRVWRRHSKDRTFFLPLTLQFHENTFARKNFASTQHHAVRYGVDGDGKSKYEIPRMLFLCSFFDYFL